MCSRALACPLRWCTSLRAAQASAALMTWSRLVRPMDVVSNPCMQQQRQLRDISNRGDAREQQVQNLAVEAWLH